MEDNKILFIIIIITIIIITITITILIIIIIIIIPLTNQVRGPYRKLRTEFFPSPFMAQARSARAINRRGKTRIRNLQYGPRKRG